MKDKRQRMALSWPFGMVDPSMYSYLLSAAANLSAAQGFHAQNRPAWNFIHPALQVPPALSALQVAHQAGGGGHPSFMNCPPRPPQLHNPMCGSAPPFPNGDPEGNPLHAMALGHRLGALAAENNSAKYSGFHPYSRKLIDVRDLENSSPNENEESGRVRDLKVLISPEGQRKDMVIDMSSGCSSSGSDTTDKNSKNSPGKSFFRPFEAGEKE